MTLRFLKFGYDTAVWPFALFAVILLPVFYTGDDDAVGYFAFTANNLINESTRLWVLAVCCFLQYCYVLRRWWIEWEVFIPLRYNFLEKGDEDVYEFQQEQYRHTCIVEYVPAALRSDERLFEYFDSVFPGQIRRAEVLLNTEHLKRLIERRQYHIEGYEDVYAKKVFKTAQYLRMKDEVEKNSFVVGCCKGMEMKVVQKPKEPLIVVSSMTEELYNNAFFGKKVVRDSRTYKALPYHYNMIQTLNEKIDVEFLRLVEHRRNPPPPARRETLLEKLLGLKYLSRTDTLQVRCRLSWYASVHVVDRTHVVLASF